MPTGKEEVNLEMGPPQCRNPGGGDVRLGCPPPREALTSWLYFGSYNHHAEVCLTFEIFMYFLVNLYFKNYHVLLQKAFAELSLQEELGFLCSARLCHGHCQSLYYSDLFTSLCLPHQPL